MLRMILVLLTLQLIACTDQSGTEYIIDLESCTIAGRPMLEVLQWDPTVTAPIQEIRRFQQFAIEAADHGVYFGLCGIDVEHGQAMALRIPDLELGRPGFQGQIRPSINGNTTISDILAKYGHPIVTPEGRAFSEVRHSGDRIGKFADWSSICEGLTMRLDFNHRDQVSAITIYPTPSSE